ncbi:MAG TPA: SRPBCC family protein [Bacillota bacterium]|nr:SRPBCC family protein [Bacillota bacterium]
MIRDEEAIPLAGGPQQVYSVFIKSSPERVWQAVTDPAFTARYFYGSRIECRLEAGAPLRHLDAEGNAMVEGEVLEADPPRRFVHTWRSSWIPAMAADAPSRVTWEITPVDGGVTQLTLTHDQFDGETATYREVAGGWSYVLSGLKTLVETGQPLAG